MLTLNDTPVLVTGAGGFIGSHLVEALVGAGANVRALVHYNAQDRWGNLDGLPAEVLARVEVVAGDVRDAALVHAAVDGCEVIFHLAALIGIPYSYRAPRSYLDTNIAGTLNVLEAARAHGVRRIVHTSTSEVYGSAREALMSEDHPLSAQSPYAASKIAADKMAEAYHRSFDLPVVTLRPFNTYGPRQSARAVIPTLIAQALLGPDLAVGALAPVRDFVFVEDTVTAFLGAAAAPRIEGEVFHVGTGIGTSIGRLAKLILKLMGHSIEGTITSAEERRRPDASEVDQLICSADKARSRLDWAPAHDLEAGLRRTIAFVRANSARYRGGRYTT